MSTPEILYLCDDKGTVHGVYLPLASWNKVEDAVLAALAPAKAADALPPEPLADWKTLTEYWDYKYPVNTEVRCDLCGAATADWQADEPRLFWLKACNLGGLVSYLCLGCGARVTKRLYKDKITFQATAPVEKDPRMEGRHG